ncbi:MAG: BBE domain-containing protein [Frankiaceae bacterium]
MIVRTPDAAGFAGHVDWARAARGALSRYGPDAMYVNFTGEADADKVRASYPPATYARLAAVKGRYDPTNMFKLNQNIAPSAPTVPAPAAPPEGRRAQS